MRRRQRDLGEGSIPLRPSGRLVIGEIDRRDLLARLPAATRWRRREPERIGAVRRLAPPRTGHRHALDIGGHYDAAYEKGAYSSAETSPATCMYSPPAMTSTGLRSASAGTGLRSHTAM